MKLKVTSQTHLLKSPNLSIGSTRLLTNRGLDQSSSCLNVIRQRPDRSGSGHILIRQQPDQSGSCLILISQLPNRSGSQLLKKGGEGIFYLFIFFAQKPLGGSDGNGNGEGLKKMLKSLLEAVLLSASVRRFFVSCMRDFCCCT